MHATSSGATVLRVLVLLTSVGLVAMAGCSGGKDKWVKGRPPVFKASGKVLYKGEPLDDALVLYQPTSGDTAAHGKTNAEGKFVLSTFGENDGAPAGSYKVVITKIEYIVKPTAYNSPEENAVARMPKHLLPAKYSKKETTDLTADVSSSGANETVFEIKD
jgi:hypothetical protein